MASPSLRASAQTALQHPNVRKFLDMIAYAEGVKHGYRTGFGNVLLPEALTDHPRTLRAFTDTNGKGDASSAAGRYQFIQKTWDDVAKALALRDFTPESQDLAAVELMRRNGSLDLVLKGDWRGAILKAGPTWAGLPSSPYPQSHKSWSDVLAQLPTQPADFGTPLSALATPQNPGAKQPAPTVASLTAGASDWRSQLAAERGMVAPGAPTPLSPTALRAAGAKRDATGAPVLTDANDMPAVRALIQTMVKPKEEAPPEITELENRLSPEEDKLLFSAVAADTKSARDKALASFSGEDYVPDVALPPGIDDSINKYLAQL